MSKLPIVSFAVMDKLLTNLGFVAVRQKGSHVFYQHADGQKTHVPKYQEQDLSYSWAKI